MNSLKITLLASALAATVAMPVFAAEPQPAPLPRFSAADASLIFETDTRPMQLAVLSQAEMKETEGAFLNWVVGGIAGGGLYAVGVYRGQYDWNTGRFLGNVGTGALIGGTFGAAGAIASGGARFIPSLTNLGANVWRFNGAAANTGVNNIWRR